MMDVKIPDAPKQTPRCPLCHATFDRKFDPQRQANLDEMLKDAINKFKLAEDDKLRAKARRWCEVLEASIKGGACEVFLCHFCKTGIGANDPMVGKWEEVYAKGEKIFCPACEHEMRFFCTSTGFMLAQCPVKACRSRMQLSAPDRQATSDQKLYDSAGNEIALPNIDRAIATPENPAIGQVGGAGADAALPGEVTLPLPGEGHA